MITYKSDSKDSSLGSREDSMPVLAMCYDFDKTLTPDDMQAQGFIQSRSEERRVGKECRSRWSPYH